MVKPRPRNWFQRNWKWLVPVYVVLLIASHVVTDFLGKGDEEPELPRHIIEVEGKRLGYLEWGKKHGGTPIILVHGSPSTGASDFKTLGPALANHGRWVIALDRWGWGSSDRWVRDYSFLADANAITGLMDQLGIKQAHLAGMSYGGGPVLLVAERDPKRVKSVSLISSVGLMEGEGSGHYAVEQSKYVAGYPVVMALGELVPHFGLLGKRADRHAMMRDFRDADQRALESYLIDLQVPLLILHGNTDPLVPSWVAKRHHEVQPASRMVMLDASHFFIFADKESKKLQIAARELGGFSRAADKGKAKDHYGFINESSWQDFHGLWGAGPRWRGYKPLWALAAACLVAGFFLPRTSAALAGLGGGFLLFDFVTALVLVIAIGLVKQREGIRRGKLVILQIVIGLAMALVGGGVLAVL